ncbi:hypothetical protein J4234_03655 [Candidatus Woesearchaeota archaeon]|nr:hypothetical protein [Candidatus Woesearchaeota archaeon]
MKRRGQVTLFVAAGILLLGGFILFAIIRDTSTSKLEPEIENVRIDDTNIRNFVQSCVDKTSKDAVFYLGFIGGNLKEDAFPNFYNFDTSYRLPYYYHEGKSFILTEQEFNDLVLAKYINENLRECTNGFKSFKNTRIADNNPKTSVELTDNEAAFNIIYPVSINRGFKTRNLDSNYVTEVKARLKDIIAIARHIVADETENDRYIHWDYLTDVSNRNYNITAYTHDENTIIYRIIDLENEIDDEPYIFQWANKINLAK